MFTRSQGGARSVRTQGTKMKRQLRKRSGSKEAVEQLDSWCKSGITLRLVLPLESFSIWHTGHLSKITNPEIYFFHTDEGGATFHLHPLSCQPSIHRTDFSTTVSFRKRRAKIGLNLIEWPGDTRSAEEVFRAHGTRTGLIQ